MAQLINLKPFRDFFRSHQSGGIILILSVIISLLIANSQWGDNFQHLLASEYGFQSNYIDLRYSIFQWINDGLMALFFLLVGLEIKREFIEGELSSSKKAALPVIAAFGGMLIPASIYLFINYNTPTAHGWGIPVATDIAFALGIVSLLGKSIPPSLKIFMAALAIVDDLGAIIVIAIFYTSELHWTQLGYAAGILFLLILFNKAGIKKLAFYIIPGIFLWYFIHHSGIHATVAGVLLAFTIPTNRQQKISPLEKLEGLLVKPVNFLIMPIFALANTNIRFERSMITELSSPLSLGIILGLILGKPIGITLFSWLTVKSGIGTLPTGANWKHIAGLGILAGIGFTMSIFIALLSFKDPAFGTEAKFAILIASVISGIAGYIFLSTRNHSR